MTLCGTACRGRDPLFVLPDCDALGLHVCVSPGTELQEAEVQEHWLRRDLRPPVTVVSDGVSVPRGIGFAAVLLDSESIAAHFWCNVAVADPTSWAAEWLGKGSVCNHTARPLSAVCTAHWRQPECCSQ